MGHKEHIKDENRTIEDFLKIKFYKEGNFWRAYEWSAYLCEFFPNGLSENDKLKPTYKEIKGVDGGMIFVGFPTSSFKKFFPTIDNKDFFNDKDGVKIIDVSKEFNKIAFENIGSILNEWKKKYKTVLPKSEKSSSNSFKCNNTNDIIQSLKTFPIESKTPIECLIFLSDLKKKIFNNHIKKDE